MPTLSKEQILAGLKDLPTKSVSVPELGGDVIVRTLTAAEIDAWEESNWRMSGGKRTLDLGNLRARFVALTVVDEKGNQLFNELEAQILGRGNGRAVDRIYDAAQKFNARRKEDVEEFAKNSGTGLSAGSTSDSPATSA